MSLPFSQRDGDLSVTARGILGIKGEGKSTVSTDFEAKSTRWGLGMRFFFCFLSTEFLHTIWQSKALGDGMYAERAIPEGFYWRGRGENDTKVI